MMERMRDSETQRGDKGDGNYSELKRLVQSAGVTLDT